MGTHNVFKNIFKNPMLAIGILCMAIFLMQLSQKGYFRDFKEKRMPTSCKAVLVMLNRRIPNNWATNCEGNNLVVEVLAEKLKGERVSDPLRRYLYRELANTLDFIAKNSPEDNLENVFIIRLSLIHTSLQINAITEGKFIVKFKTMTDKGLILDHLKNTVQVKEVMP
jgi:hypothetical protein